MIFKTVAAMLLLWKGCLAGTNHFGLNDTVSQGPASRRATHTARCPVTKHQCGSLKKQKSLSQQMQKRHSHRKHEKMIEDVRLRVHAEGVPGTLTEFAKRLPKLH